MLQLKGEKELALKIYERGLTKVKFDTDKDRNVSTESSDIHLLISMKTLQSMYNKLLRAQNPTKSLDPLEYLPIELAQLVIHHLGMRDRV